MEDRRNISVERHLGAFLPRQLGILEDDDLG